MFARRFAEQALACAIPATAGFLIQDSCWAHWLHQTYGPLRTRHPGQTKKVRIKQPVHWLRTAAMLAQLISRG